MLLFLYDMMMHIDYTDSALHAFHEYPETLNKSVK